MSVGHFGIRFYLEMSSSLRLSSNTPWQTAPIRGNRRDAERLIMHTMGDFRRREVRKWWFGTRFTEFHHYDQSIDADRVRSDYRRAQEVARVNDVPRGRSPRTTRGLSHLDEVAHANRRHPGQIGPRLQRPGGAAPFPLRERHLRLLRRLDHSSIFAESTDNESNAPSFGGGASSSFRPGDAEDAARSTPVPRDPSPAQRWLQEPSAALANTEAIDVEHDEPVPPAEPPATKTSKEVTEALWQCCHDEVEARRAQREEPRDPWDAFESEWVQENIFHAARPAAPALTFTTSSTEVIPVKARPTGPPARPIAVLGLSRLRLPQGLRSRTYIPEHGLMDSRRLLRTSRPLLRPLRLRLRLFTMHRYRLPGSSEFLRDDAGPEHADLVCSGPRNGIDPDRRASELLLSRTGVTHIRGMAQVFM